MESHHHLIPLFEHDLRANAFRICREGKPVSTFPDNALAARQRNRGASELAFRLDHDRLLVASGRERQVGSKSGACGDDLKHPAARAPFDVAVDVATGLAPGPRHRGALRHEIAGQIESVTVAGAGQGLLQAVAAGAHGIGGAAANSLGRPVVQGDRAPAGPVTGQAGEWPARLSVASRPPKRNGQQRGGSKHKPPREGEERDFSARMNASTILIARCTVLPQMLHSTTPVRHCHRVGRFACALLDMHH